MLERVVIRNKHGADKLTTESVGEMNIHRLGRKRKLRHVDEFLMVMMRLRLGLLVKDLEYRFKLSAGPRHSGP